MKMTRFFIWLFGLINLALILMLLIASAPDRAALISAETISVDSVSDKAASVSTELDEARTGVAELQTDVTGLTAELAAYELSLSGQTDIAADGSSVAASGSTLLYDSAGQTNEVSEIRVSYIIQQVNAQVDDFMTYSDVNMTYARRSFASGTTEAEMIDALVSRFTAEHDAHGCDYFRLEYIGVQYNKVGTAEYVFYLYFS